MFRVEVKRDVSEDVSSVNQTRLYEMDDNAGRVRPRREEDRMFDTQEICQDWIAD